MNTTSLSLLQLLVNPPHEPARQAAWTRFAQLYAPLLLAWAQAQRLQDTDAADFVQEVLVRVYRALPQYQRTEGARFRGWLFTIVRHMYRDFGIRLQRRRAFGTDGLAEFQDPTPPDAVAEMDEREYRLRLVRQVLEVIGKDFTPVTLAAFRLLAVEGRSSDEVVAELGISAEAARSAHRRVLARIREELRDFLS